MSVHAARIAVLARPGRELGPLAERGVKPDDLEPPVRVGHQEEAAVRQPVRAALPGRSLRDPELAPRRNLDDRHRRPPVTILALPGHGDPGPVRRPAELLDVPAGRCQRDRLGGPWVRRRPAAPRDRGVDPPQLRPAAATGDEGEAVTVGRPAWPGVAGPVLGHADLARPVGVDHPDRAVADEGQPSSVGRPLRVGDRLLRGGDLDRLAATERHHEQLPGTTGFGCIGDRPVARMDPVFARWVEPGGLLDRERIAGRRSRIGGVAPGRLGRHRRADSAVVSALASSCSPSSTVRR